MTEQLSQPSAGYDDFLRDLKERIRGVQVADVYPDEQFVQRPVAQIPWGYNVRFLDTITGKAKREWHMHQTIEHGCADERLRSTGAV